MFNFLLPEQIEIGLKPVLDAEHDLLEIYFSINNKPMLQFICKQIIKITKGDITEQIKIQPEKVIIHIPNLVIPYRIKSLNMDEFSITLTKE